MESRGYAELSLPLTDCDTLESPPHFSHEAAFERIGPVPSLGNRVELALVAKARVSQPQGHRYGRADPSPHYTHMP